MYNRRIIIELSYDFFKAWTPKVRGEYDTKKCDLKEEKKRTNKN